MPELSGRFIAVRPDDHVILGVRWWGAEPRLLGGIVGLRFGPDGGGLLVTFPPQHIGEGLVQTGIALPLGTGALSGPSQLAVAIDPNTELVLDVPGLLAALRAGRVLGRRLDDGADATLLELPFGLQFTPTSASGGDAMCVHPVRPVPGPASAVALWRTRVRGSGADPLSALGGRGDDVRYAEAAVVRREVEPVDIPLDAAKRQQIVDATTGRPAQVSRLELSALGGSLNASVFTDHLDWSHTVALGRDQRIRFVEHGILYPFGHRALYIEATERELDGNGIAALRIHRSLIVTEPSKSTVVGDPALNRMFPFDEVEITTRVFSDLGPPLHHHFTRPGPSVAAETRERDEKVTLSAELLASIAAELTRDREVEELGTPEAAEYIEQQQKAEAAARSLAEAEEMLANHNRVRDDIEATQDALDALDETAGQFEHDNLKADLAGLQAELARTPAPAPGSIEAFKSQLATADAELERLGPIIAEQCQRDLSVGELAGGDPENPAVQTAKEILAIDDRIAELNAIIEASADPAVEREWIIGPTVLPAPPLPPTAPAESLAPLLFPLRCSTRTSVQPDVHMSVPLAFIVEFRLEADDVFPAFDSLVDGHGGRPLQEIMDEFCASRTRGGVTVPDGTDRPRLHDGGSPVRGIGVELPPVAVDVVHGATTMAGDHLELHGLTLAGLPHGRGFIPKVTEFRAALPALRGVLGETHDVVRAFRYRDDFLTNGEAEDIVLDLVDGAVGVDFRTRADRSGALIAPVIEASGVSRSSGPVSVEGMLESTLGDLDPHAILGEGTTLLGFDLRDLIGRLPAPPQIVQGITAGPPTVTVRWGVDPGEGGQPVVLKSAGLFDAEPRPGTKATFTLTATMAPDGVTTRCVVRNFALSFPSPQDPLLKLTFGSVEFKRDPGGEPDLSVHGVDVDFLGDLRLLGKLQEAVNLGGNVPKVQVAASGIGVGYAFQVPNADCGLILVRNIAVRAGLDVPFQPTDEQPVVLSLGFASRTRPFNVSYMALGGGGYIEVQLDKGGIRRLEVSLEFGATLALNLGVVAAEVYAMAGVRAELGPGDSVSLTGFVRIGGSVDLLGLVSVTLELVVSLRYEPEPDNALVGSASVVVEIDLTLYSDSIELESGEWRIEGGDVLEIEAGQPDLEAGLAAWRRYRGSFAEEMVV